MARKQSPDVLILLARGMVDGEIMAVPLTSHGVPSQDPKKVAVFDAANAEHLKALLITEARAYAIVTSATLTVPRKIGRATYEEGRQRRKEREQRSAVQPVLQTFVGIESALQRNTYP